ncbi:MAG: Gfo/Idh/MocA family oxidoreductase [Anaerolineales bacterium]
MTPLRTAILGCGGFARRHAAILAKLEEIELVGFCNQGLEKAEAFNQQYAGGRAQVFGDYEAMFAELALDLVYICLPPYAHGNEVALACQHGAHFLIEKPIALDMALAESMAADVAASGVKSQVGFMFRFGEAARQLKQRLPPTGGAGFMVARYACNSLHKPWWRQKNLSGGQLVEQAIHLLDMARFFLGEPVQVYAMQGNLFHQGVERYTADDASGTTIRFASGGLAVLAATNGAIPNRWEYDWRLMLPGLTADFSDANHAVFHDTRPLEPGKAAPAETVAGDGDLYLAETLDLLAAIRDDRPTAVPIEEGVRTLRLALAASQAAERNAPVDLVVPA